MTQADDTGPKWRAIEHDRRVDNPQLVLAQSTVENLNGLIYEKAYSSESFGSYGAIGMELHLALSDRDINQADMRLIQETLGELREKLMGNTLRLNQRLADEAAEQKKSLMDLFNCPVFVEQCSNEYSKGAWGEIFPWFKVTTSIGRIKIGWRKRVINIDWSETTVTSSGKELFPHEDVTKGGVHYESDRNNRYIHAHGLDDARTYIETIIKAGADQV